MKTMIIGCVDPRVDPVDIFGLVPGEAAVIRNVGGRITPATLQTMAMLRIVAIEFWRVFFPPIVTSFAAERLRFQSLVLVYSRAVSLAFLIYASLTRRIVCQPVFTVSRVGRTFNVSSGCECDPI
jgi:hypothetical protein